MLKEPEVPWPWHVQSFLELGLGVSFCGCLPTIGTDGGVGVTKVIQAVEQFRKVFTTMFECYASLRDNQHMAESDLVSFCSDFCLVPDLVPRHEIHRVYMMAECLFKHPVAASLSSSLTSDLSNVSTLSVPSRGSGPKRVTVSNNVGIVYGSLKFRQRVGQAKLWAATLLHS